MASRFWVGGTGNWDAATTTHWSATTGGAGGASVPTSADDVTFDANSGTAATVTITAPANANNITINKSDLTLLHNAGSTTAATMTLTLGTLNTNGQTCSWNNFASNSPGTRVLTLGASNITLASNWNIADNTSLTFTAGTSTLTFSGGSSQFGTGPLAYNNLVFNNISQFAISINFGAGTTCANLTLNGGTDSRANAQLSNPLVVTGTFTTTGNSGGKRLLVTSNTFGTVRTITAAAVSITNTDFMDITGAGAAAPFTGTLVGDAGGNSGITFTTSVAQTWQGTASGNWSDVTKWTSRVPLPQDDVTVSPASGTPTITPDVPRLGRSVTMSGTFSVSLASGITPLQVFGSLILAAGVTNSGGGGQFQMAGRNGSFTLSMNGSNIFTSTFTINAPGSTITLGSDFTVQTPTQAFVLSRGSLVDAGFTVTAGTFSAQSTATGLTMTGTWNVRTWNMQQPTLTMSAGSSTINLTDPTALGATFTGLGFSYGTVRHIAAGAAGLAITGNNTYKLLDLEDTTARTVTLPASGTQTVTRMLTLQGAAGQNLSLVSSTPGTATTIVVTGAVALIDPGTVTLSGDITMTVANKGAYFPFTGASSTQYTASAWVTGAGGGTVRIALFDMVTGKQASSAVTLSATAQRISVTATTGAASSGFAALVETDVAQAARTFTIDGLQVEQKSFITPYVETNGATATRSAARVQVYVNKLFTPTQGWFAVRARMGRSAASISGGEPDLFMWADSASSYLRLQMGLGTSWLMRAKTATTDVQAQSAGQTFVAGDFATVIGKYGAFGVAVSVNGGAFTTAAATLPVITAATFDIGSGGSIFSGQHIDSDVFWAAFGSGTLADADAVTINGFANTDHIPTDFPGTCTGIWWANTGITYQS